MMGILALTMAGALAGLTSPARADEAESLDRLRATVLGLPGMWIVQDSAPALPGRRAKRNLQDYKTLLNTNIFSPPMPKAPPPPPAPSVPPRTEDRPREPRRHVRMLSITGFVLNGAAGRYEAVVEDPSSAATPTRFCGVGDDLGEGKIVEITAYELKHQVGDRISVMRVGDQIAVEGKGTEASSSSGVEPLEPERRERSGRRGRRQKEVQPDSVEDVVEVKKKR
ncbi:MAG: hypothetical protein HY716_15045 [Planctomycetes bacterium]|nr:hypothetical protein [Planctomycetota bacterium]